MPPLILFLLHQDWMAVGVTNHKSFVSNWPSDSATTPEDTNFVCVKRNFRAAAQRRELRFQFGGAPDYWGCHLAGTAVHRGETRAIFMPTQRSRWEQSQSTGLPRSAKWLPHSSPARQETTVSLFLHGSGCVHFDDSFLGRISSYQFAP